MPELSDLRDRLQAVESDRDRFHEMAEHMSAVFHLTLTDVSILLERNGVLVFRYPQALERCTVPITRKSVAGMTFENNKIYVYNNLTEVEHVELFEKLVRTEDGTMPVQRIISCPIPSREGPKGVLQLCRKGKTRDSTQPFVRQDVDRVAEIAKTCARFL